MPELGQRRIVQSWPSALQGKRFGHRRDGRYGSRCQITTSFKVSVFHDGGTAATFVEGAYEGSLVLRLATGIKSPRSGNAAILRTCRGVCICRSDSSRAIELTSEVRNRFGGFDQDARQSATIGSPAIPPRHSHGRESRAYDDRSQRFADIRDSRCKGSRHSKRFTSDDSSHGAARFDGNHDRPFGSTINPLELVEERWSSVATCVPSVAAIACWSSP